MGERSIVNIFAFDVLIWQHRLIKDETEVTLIADRILYHMRNVRLLCFMLSLLLL